MKTIAFCDPGLDRVSIAVFRFEPVPGRQVWKWASMQDKIRTLDVVDAVKTSPKDSLADRLLAIGRGVHISLKRHGVERFYIEIPRVAGAYKRRAKDGTGAGEGHGKFQADMQFTHYATGAIVAAAGTVLPGRVELVKAAGQKKEWRLDNVRTLLISIGRRGEIRNADDLDAVSIGILNEWPG